MIGMCMANLCRFNCSAFWEKLVKPSGLREEVRCNARDPTIAERIHSDRHALHDL